MAVNTSSNNPFDDDLTPPEMPSPPTGTPKSKDTDKESSKTSKQLEDIATWLLDEGLILTCLELHTELLESGKQVALLKDYFSNPGNFETAIPQPIKSDLCKYMYIVSPHLFHMHMYIRGVNYLAILTWNLILNLVEWNYKYMYAIPN